MNSLINNKFKVKYKSFIISVLCRFIMASMAHTANRMTKEERERRTLECYSKYFDSTEALKVCGIISVLSIANGDITG